LERKKIATIGSEYIGGGCTQTIAAYSCTLCCVNAFCGGRG